MRTDIQRELYSLEKKNNSLKGVCKNILSLPYKKQLREKYFKFEDFINTKLRVSNIIYNSENELEKISKEFDYYISGSDQVWNIRSKDFSWANLLDFCKSGRKISYAASFGPLKIDWEKYDKEKFKNLLNQYTHISVREEGSNENIKKLIGKDALIHVDPTMLLSKEEWVNLLDLKKIKNKKYILFYSLEPNEEMIKLVKKVSKILNLPIVVTKYNNKFDYLNSFKKEYSTGPIDFLELIYNAELVLSSSFHGTVFSILFNKNFYAINGMDDNRINTLLKSLKLEMRSISLNNIEEKCLKAFDVDFSDANKRIDEERSNSKLYLTKVLDFSGENNG